MQYIYLFIKAFLWVGIFFLFLMDIGFSGFQKILVLCAYKWIINLQVCKYLISDKNIWEMKIFESICLEWINFIKRNPEDFEIKALRIWKWISFLNWKGKYSKFIIIFYKLIIQLFFQHLFLFINFAVQFYVLTTL